jgi:hypothetical protein
MKIRDRIRGLARIAPERIRPNPKNWRTHPQAQRDALRGVLADVGVVDAVLVRPCDAAALEALAALPEGDASAFAAWLDAFAGDFVLVDGHLRVEELQAHQGSITVLVVDLDDREAAEILATFDPVGDLAGMDKLLFVDNLADFNSTNPAVQALVADLAGIDARMQDAAGATPDGDMSGDPLADALRDLPADLPGQEGSAASGPEPPASAPAPEEPKRRTLAERFGVPPFSVLDARQGYWQERKRAWLALGIRSEVGRGGDLMDLAGPMERKDGYSADEEAAREAASRVCPGGSPDPLARYRAGLPTTWNDDKRRAETERAAQLASPGRSRMPAMRLREDGHTQRGDGKGRPVAEA